MFFQVPTDGLPQFIDSQVDDYDHAMASFPNLSNLVKQGTEKPPSDEQQPESPARASTCPSIFPNTLAAVFQVTVTLSMLT